MDPVRAENRSGVELLMAAMRHEVVDLPESPDLRTEMQRQAGLDADISYAFPARTRHEMALHVMRHGMQPVEHGRFRLWWNASIRGHAVDGYPADGKGLEVDSRLDDVWNVVLSDEMIAGARDEFVTPYLDGECESYPGDDQGDWSFVVSDVDGPLLLDTWRGRDMSFPSFEDLGLYLHDELSDRDLSAFYNGIVTFDHDLADPAGSVSSLLNEIRAEREALWKEDPVVVVDEVLRRLSAVNSAEDSLAPVAKAVTTVFGWTPEEFVVQVLGEVRPEDLVEAAKAMGMDARRLVDVCESGGYHALTQAHLNAYEPDGRAPYQAFGR